MSQFDAGLEAVLRPTEKVIGSYTFSDSTTIYEAEVFGVTIRHRRLSSFTLSGESGWEASSSDGIVSQQSATRRPGSFNNPALPSDYIYRVQGGEVSLPTSSVTAGPANQDDLNEGGPWEDPVDLPDFVPLPVLTPTVWKPTLELVLTSPSDLWNQYGDSPLPPPLSEATSAIIKLHVDVFVPLVGYQRRTATFEVTEFTAVPVPSSFVLGLAALAGGLERRRLR